MLVPGLSAVTHGQFLGVLKLVKTSELEASRSSWAAWIIRKKNAKILKQTIAASIRIRWRKEGFSQGWERSA